MINHTRAKLFRSLQRGSILELDCARERAYLQHQARREEVPWGEARRWAAHVLKLTRKEESGPSTSISSIRVVETDGTARRLQPNDSLIQMA